MDIGPIKAAQKRRGRGPIKQPGDNFLLGLGIRRGGKGRQWHIQGAPQFANAQIVGTKIMPPLADTMGFVHGDHLHVCTPQ